MGRPRCGRSPCSGSDRCRPRRQPKFFALTTHQGAPHRTAPRQPAGAAGGQGGPDRRAAGAVAGSGPWAGRIEHAEPFGVGRAGGGGEAPLQEDRRGPVGAGPAAGGRVPGVAKPPAGGDLARPGRHRRPAARRPGGSLLPRLLQGLLLSAAVHLLRRASAVRAPAAVGHRRPRRRGGGAAATPAFAARRSWPGARRTA